MAAFEQTESKTTKPEAVDHSHVMSDVLTTSDNSAKTVQEGFNSFAEHYHGYLLDRVTRLMNTEYGSELLQTIAHQAKQGEPLYALLLADLQHKNLIPQRA